MELCSICKILTSLNNDFMSGVIFSKLNAKDHPHDSWVWSVESTGQYAARSFFRLWIEECLCNILIKIEKNTSLFSLSMGNRIVSFQQPSKYSKGPFWLFYEHLFWFWIIFINVSSVGYLDHLLSSLDLRLLFNSVVLVFCHWSRVK